MSENKKSINKTAIAILTIALIGISYFAYKIYMDSVILKSEKTSMIANLTKSRDSISLVINENSSIKNELLVEQQKITNLIDDLNKSNTTIAELNQYKTEVIKLRKQVSVLKNDKMLLVEKYEALKNKQDSTVSVLENAVKSNTKLEELNTDMNRMVKKSSRVMFAQIKTETLIRSKTGSAVLNDNYKKVNFFRLSFVIVGNKLTTPIEKEYYVQVINPSNNVIGNKFSKKFGPMVLDYSYASSFKYVDANLDVTTGMDLTNSEKGTYLVNVFDKDQLVLKSSFNLK
jgi:hypothetical protein